MPMDPTCHLIWCESHFHFLKGQAVVAICISSGQLPVSERLEARVVAILNRPDCPWLEPLEEVKIFHGGQGQGAFHTDPIWDPPESLHILLFRLALNS